MAGSSFAIAVRCHQSGDFRRAASLYRDILREDPHHAGASHLLGVACHQQGDLDQAAMYIRRAIEFDGSKGVYYNNLGVVIRAQGRPTEAESAYRQALAIRPQYADALSNLAALMHEQGRHEEALDLFRRALQAQPAHADAIYNLGNLYRDLGRTVEAIDCYRKTIAVQPGRAGAHNNLGNALLAERREAEAIASYQQALALDSTCAEAHLNLGIVYAEQDRAEEAVACFGRASQRRPEKRLWWLRSATLCPSVFQSVAELDRYRNGLEAALGSHQDAAVGADWRELVVDGVVPSFNLAHHGRNNRPLLEKFAGLYPACFPASKPACGSGKPRIGFLVTRHHEGGFLRGMSGIIEQLDPSRFEPAVLCSHGALENCRRGIRRTDVQWVAFPDRFASAAERIAAARCDVLYHWQVGTDPLNYFLPFARLAPVQCTGWGSHGTTGNAAIDYCLSSDWIESPGAEQHYTESLVRLKTLPTYERIQPLAAPARRSDFGLPENGHLYCCPQRLAKLHPEADVLFAAILEQDVQGFLVVLEGKVTRAAELLRRRFSQTLGPLAGRVIFVPSQSPDDFRRFLTLADVIVDPPHYSSGLTAYDAITLGLPIVSLPDEFAVGRYVLGCYGRMGLEDWVPTGPEEYVALAVKLGGDREYREGCRAELARRREVLFEDVEVVREYERFFEEAVERARQETG
ncbi:MAG: tetratricopeptide repeat protein [Planctomycetota bacterium]|nr:tetratricopeptide repeat protein [Planctomycetota bacterium]